MADQGFKVSQPGFDVKTATDQQLSFSSKWFLLKVYIQGSASFSVPNDSALYTLSIAHNLGYRPAFIVRATAHNDPGRRYSVPYSTGPLLLMAKADNNNLILASVNSGPTQNADFYYYIFADRGGP